jgi:tetratricopeptide (TPR) repeat protein
VKSRSVFLSYARAESSQHVRSLAKALSERGIEAFLDTSDVELNNQFLGPMIDALLESRVVVVFLGDVYFTRPACLRELEVAQAVHHLELASDREGASDGGSALRHVIAVLPPGGSLDLVYKRLAWAQAQTAWTTADDTEALAKSIDKRLSEVRKPIRSRLIDIDAAYVREHAVRIPDVDERLSEWAGDERRWFHPSGVRPLTLGDAFVGRGDELFRLRNELEGYRKQGSEPFGVIVSGRPGSGKTRLVQEYVSRFGHEWSAVWWMDANGDALSIDRQQYGIASRLLRLVHGERTAVPTMADLELNGCSLVDFFAEALEQVPPETRPLLIVDNVPEDSPRRPFRLETYCPRPALIPVLLTRRQKWQAPGFASIVAKELAPTAAVMMLTRGLVRRGVVGFAQWQGIAKWVGYLPLALGLLNAAMAPSDNDQGQDPLDPQELLEHVRRPSKDLTPTYEPLTKELPRQLLGAVLDAFALSFGRLDQDTQEAATVLAYFGPGSIPTAAVEALSERPSARSLDALHQRSFLRDPSAGAARIEGSMHRLLSEYLRLRSNSPRRATQVCIALMHVQNTYLPNNPANWPLLDLCFDHVQSVVGWRPVEEGSFDGLDALRRQQVRTGGYYGLLLDTQGRISQARAWTEHMYDRSSNILGPADVFTVLLANQLADFRRASGHDVAAANVISDTFKATREDQSTSPLAKGLATLAAAEHGIADATRDAPDILTSLPTPVQLMHRMIEASHRAATESTVALSECQQIIAETTAAYGAKALTTLKAREVYAFALAKSDMPAAIAQQEAVVNLRREEAESDKRSLADSLLSLGSLYGRAKLLASARSAQEEAVRIRKRLLTKEHPDTLNAMSDLAFTIAMQNEHGRANRIFAEVVSTGRRVLGDASPLTLGWIGWQAWQFARSGNVGKATVVRRSAIQKAAPVLGASHASVMSLKEDLLKELIRQKAHADAYDLALILVGDTRSVFGEDSKETLVAMETAANCGFQANATGAADLLRQVHHLGSRLFGPDHAGVQNIKARLDALASL